MRKYYPKPTTLKSAIKGKVKDTAKKSLSMGNKNYPRKIVSDAKKTVKKDFPELYSRAATGMKKGGSTIKNPSPLRRMSQYFYNKEVGKKNKKKKTDAMMKVDDFKEMDQKEKDLMNMRVGVYLDKMKKEPAKKTKKVTGMKKGGSTVNKAGNYTKPTMRKALFNRIKAGGKGGRPGQWSARKAQMLAKQYKAKGGGYRG